MLAALTPLTPVMRTPSVFLAALLVATASSTHGQTAQATAALPRVTEALSAIRSGNAWTLDQQQSICEIAAPPFREAARGAEYRRRLEALGLTGVRIDSVGNVIAQRAGVGTGPTVVLAGHLDTVFPDAPSVTVTRSGTRFAGLGIGDDCRGLAVVLAVAKAFQNANIQTAGTVYFVGDVGEEGPGNSRGVRHLLTRELKGKVAYFISVDGTQLSVTSRAVGSNRYRVAYTGPGGHSYGAFGMPSPIHALGRAIAKIADVQVPTAPKTTFTVGRVSGGTSVNTIADTGAMEIDMRSESAAALAKLDTSVRHALTTALDEENGRWPLSKIRLAIRMDTIGFRAAGAQPDAIGIVRTAQAAARALAFDSGPTHASSTDSNVPIALGIPAITIGGGGRGTGAHSRTEAYDDGDQGWLGPQWAALIVATLAGAR
ncbi:MAG: M20/M25/M40 family metallo-hydrolase [Gemmatimonadaceae bacterium]